MPRLPTLLAALAALPPAGCGLPLPPREIRPAADGPWVAPGEQTPLKFKEHLALYPGDPDGGYWYWLDRHGRRVKPGDVTRPLEAYLEATGHARDWAGPRPVLGRDVWRAPYDLTIASLRPTVVLMTPAPFDPADEADFFRLYHNTGEYKHPWRFSGAKLANKFFAEPRARYADGMRWFSDDLPQPPTPLTLAPDGTAAIALPDGRLVIRRAGGTLAVTRE